MRGRSIFARLPPAKITSSFQAKCLSRWARGRHCPEDIQEAISFMTHRITQKIFEYWQEAIAGLTKQADDLMPDLIRIRSTLPSEDEATKVRLHLPLLCSLLRERGMGGSDWIEQFIHGCPTIGEVGEPGVYNECSPKFSPMTSSSRRRRAGDWQKKHLMNPMCLHCGARLCRKQRKDGCQDHIDTRKKESFGLEERR